MIKSLLLRSLLALLSSLSVLAHAADEPLQAEQAFRVETKIINDNTLSTTWTIAPDYYLYRSKIRFESLTPGIELGAAKFPAGTQHHGLTPEGKEGMVEVYFKTVTIEIPFSRKDATLTNLKLIAYSQGCADKLGICYPPQKREKNLILATAKETKGTALSSLNSFSKQLGIQNDDSPLPVNQAFQANVILVDNKTVRASWRIAADYYLYREKIKFDSSTPGVELGKPQFPAGKKKHGITPDGKEGEVETYVDDVNIDIPFTLKDSKLTSFVLTLHSQGCAEKRGICYPPQKNPFTVDLAKQSVMPGADSKVAAPVQAAAEQVDDDSLTQQERVANKFNKLFKEGSTFLILLSLVGVGLLVAFTACMYPMIPIVTSIIAGQGEHTSAMKGFTLSLVYVAAFAVVFGIVGAAMGFWGEQIGIQGFLQHPIVLSVFAIIFIMLAFAMFGFYNVQMPSSIQSKLTEISGKQQGGTLFGVAIMGALSALIIGPCGGPITFAVMTIAAASNSVVLGFIYMFLFGFGMGLPLLLVGAGGGTLLPRAGDWMNVVKGVAGVILLAVALFMISSVLPETLYMMLWAALFMISAVYMGAFDRIQESQTGWLKFWKGLGIVIFIYGLIVFLGGLTGARNVLDPLHGSKLLAQANVAGPAMAKSLITSASATPATSKATVVKGGLTFIKIKSSADVHREVAQANKAGHTVMLDFYADWCVYCKQFDDYIFVDPNVQQALANTTLLQADVTAMDETDLALIKEMGAPPQPPTILFFKLDGTEVKSARIIGIIDATKFAARVNKAFVN
jgi:thiol:disulfide interchange protein DsbD